VAGNGSDDRHPCGCGCGAARAQSGDASLNLRSVTIRLRCLAACLFAFLPLTAQAAPVLGQLTLPSVATSAAPTDPGVKLEGPYLTAPIAIDGTTIFRVSVLANAPASQIPIAVRQTDVQTTIAEILATTGSGSDTKTEYDPESLRVHIDRNGDVDSLEAVDAKHSDPLAIVSVTSTDARYNQLSLDSLATQWQEALQSSLIRALEIRQPAVQRRSLIEVARVGAILVGISLAIWGLVSFLRRLAKKASDEVTEREKAADTQKDRVTQDTDGAHVERRRFLALALRNIEPEQRARIYGATAEALIWLTILAWFLAMTWAFSLFPQTTPLADSLIQGSLRVLTTIVITGLFNRILDVVIARIASVWEHQGAANSEERARLLLRIPTIAKAVGGFKTFALVFIAILAILGEIGVPIGSVVTIGGLAAIALSLAAQNFVRDFVNGSLVLFEDQYVVGDYVTINAASGIVEHLSLRMVQLRDASGDLVTIPHSSATAVINQSRNWSRVDYRIPIAPEADVPKAIELVKQSIEELARETEWRGAVTLPIEWIGVDRISKDYALVRASVRTAPLRQFAFRRAVNASVLAELVEAKIPLGAHPED
jgi:small-conductance mechanosensitive channel